MTTITRDSLAGTSGPRKPHVSPSQMDMYFRCGEQYRRRYVLGEIVPPGVALVKGGAVHRAAELNFAQKIKSREDLPLAQLTDAVSDHVGSVIAKEGLMLAPDEAARGLSAIRGELLDRAVVLAGLFHREVAPRVQPILVERFVRIELSQRSHDLLGRLDVADETDTIRDLKTSARRKTQDDVDRSDQLTFYHAAFKQETGRRARGVALDVLLDQKTPAVQTLTTERTDLDRQVFLNRLNAMLAGIKAGSFQPAALGSWCCSPRFCGWFFTCPYVNSERKAAAEAQEV